MNRFNYNTEPLKESAQRLSDQRLVTTACKSLDLSRAQFYKIVTGKSASYPSLIKVANYLQVPTEKLAISIEG
jgi:hypothetical protein